MTKPEGEKKPIDVGGVAKKVDAIVMKLDMHCEGCGKKIKRLLKHIKGIYNHRFHSVIEFL